MRLLEVVGCEERVGGSCFLAAGRAADAVNVVLGVVRIIVIYNKFHILDICGNAMRCRKNSAQRNARHHISKRKDCESRKGMYVAKLTCKFKDEPSLA